VAAKRNNNKKINMPRISINNLGLNHKLIRAKKVYQMENSNKVGSDLKSIGIKLTLEEAFELGQALVRASRYWKVIDITGYRFSKIKSDQIHHLTITSK